MLEILRQVADIYEIAGSSDARCGNDIFEFAEISGPRMLQKNGLGSPGQPGNIFCVGIVLFL